MTRVFLEKGCSVFGDREYIVDSIVGDGANSVVYNAHYADNCGFIHNVILKECYPYNSEITRSNLNLIWSNKAQRNADIKMFNDAYEKLMRFQDNSSVAAFDIFEANNTLYSVVHKDIGVTYDRVKEASLTEILETILALSKVVKKYHNAGYLHLDIKPDNFLIISETRQLIKLFDFDSVTLKSEILTAPCIPYSENWAAPEQVLGRKDKICEATDIYAIGAVLFEKVMGRKVENDDIGVFADWVFNGEMFDNVNPKIKRLLRAVFSKTLSANVSRRYSSANELIAALEEAVETVVAGKPYIISSYPAPCRYFSGRNIELNQIHNALDANQNVVFLHGDIGGIGKSELSKKYAEIHNGEYDAVVFKSFINKDSIDEVISDINVCNFDNEIDYKAISRICKSQKVLFILDNLDISIDSDINLDEFLQLNADIIITTRTDFSDVLSANAVQIEISHLKEQELFSVFSKETNLHINDSDENQKVMKVLKSIQYHTLTTTILAKHRIKAGLSIDDLCEEVSRGLDSWTASEKVVVRKDGAVFKKSPMDILKTVFNLVALSETEKEVLTILYFFGFENITKARFKQLTGNNSAQFDALNDLLESGWVQHENKYGFIANEILALHPLIVELIRLEIVPNPFENLTLISNIENIILNKLLEEKIDGFDELMQFEKDELKIACEYFASCLYYLAKRAGCVDFVVYELYKYLNANVYTIDFFDDNYYGDYYGALLRFLDFLFTNNTIVDNIKTRFYYLNVKETIHASATGCIFYDHYSHIEETSKYFFEALKIAQEYNDSEMIWKVFKPIVQIADSYGLPDVVASPIMNTMVAEVEKSRCLFEDKLCNFDFWDKKHSWFETSESENVNVSKENSEERIAYERMQEFEAQYSKMFMEGIDAQLLSNEIDNNSCLSNFEKIEMYYIIVSNVLIDKIKYEHGDILSIRNRIAELPWKQALKLLDQEEKFYLNNNVDDNELFNAYKCNVACDAFRAICYAYLEGKSDNYYEYMHYLIEDYKGHLSSTGNYNGKVPCSFYEFDSIQQLSLHCSICSVFDLLRIIEKAHLAFPYIIECAEAVNTELKKQWANTDVAMYCWNRTIIEFLDEASIEDDENYRNIYKTYSEKLAEINPQNDLKRLSEDE